MKGFATLCRSAHHFRPCQAQSFRWSHLLLLGLVVAGVHGQTVARWKPGSGSWSDPNHWDIGVVPKNAGATTYIAVLDLPSETAVVTVAESVAVSGLINREVLRIEPGASLTLSGSVTNSGTIASAGGTVSFSAATVSGAGGNVTAEGGVIGLTDSTINGGVLRVTDDAASAVRFSGEVTMNGVPWEDPGAGEFQILNTTARLLGDYAQELPAGYTLVVWRHQSWTPSQLTLGAGEFRNEGMIQLRDSGGGYRVYARLHWEGSGTLAGSGEVYLSSGGDGHLWTGAEGAVVTIGPDQWVHGWGEVRVPVENQGVLEADLSGKTLQFTQSVENTGTLHGLGGGLMHLAGGLNDTGEVLLEGGGGITINGVMSTDHDWTAGAGGTLSIVNGTVALNGHSLTAEGGVIGLTDSTINGGVLRVTDDAASAVRFSGEVTMNGVPWEDPGAGEFQILNTTARLLGDYAQELPAGYTLVVWRHQSWTPSQLTLGAGEFRNEGMIQLRDSGGGYRVYARLHWEGSGTLAGSGEVYLSSGGDGHLWTGAEGAVVTIGPDQWVHGWGEVRVPVENQGVLEADLSGKTLQFTQSVENTGTLHGLGGGLMHLAGGLNDTGEVLLEGGGGITINGVMSTDHDWTAGAGGTLSIVNGTVALNGHSLTAEGGVIGLTDSTINGGVLRVTDDAASAVRFSGEVTMNGVPWEDPGAGEFQILNTTARLLGDYAQELPAGYTLVVWRHQSWTPSQLTLGAGEFRNEGMIQLRDSGGGYRVYARLHWEGSGTLAGSGEVLLSSGGDGHLWTGAEGAVVTIGPDQWVHGWGEVRVPVENQGMLEADLTGKTLQFTQSVENTGTIQILTNAKLGVDRDLWNDGLVRIEDGTLEVEGSINLGANGRMETAAAGSFRLARHWKGVDDQESVTQSLRLVLDGGGIPTPDLGAHAFFVEAEDFNFDRGQHEPVADVMPYAGGAYEGRAGRDRIDYSQTSNQNVSDIYRVNEGPGINVNVYAISDRDRGSHRMTVNYKVGYNDATEWYRLHSGLSRLRGTLLFFRPAFVWQPGQRDPNRRSHRVCQYDQPDAG